MLYNAVVSKLLYEGNVNNSWLCSAGTGCSSQQSRAHQGWGSRTWPSSAKLTIKPYRQWRKPTGGRKFHIWALKCLGRTRCSGPAARWLWGHQPSSWVKNGIGAFWTWKKSLSPQRQPQMWRRLQVWLLGHLHNTSQGLPTAPRSTPSTSEANRAQGCWTRAFPAPGAGTEPSIFQSQMGTGGCRAGNLNNLGYWYAKHSRHSSFNFLLRAEVWMLELGSLMRKHMSWLSKQPAGSTELRLQCISREYIAGLGRETELRAFSPWITLLHRGNFPKTFYCIPMAVINKN